MTNYRLINIFLLFILTNFAYAGSSSVPGTDGYSVNEIPLTVAYKKVEAKVLISDPIRNSAVTKEFAVFASSRKAWVLTKQGKLASIDPKKFLPHKFNWYGSVCNAGDQVVILVANYPEAESQLVREKPLGGFRSGPAPVGVMVVGRKGVKFIDKFSAVYTGAGIKNIGKGLFSQLPVEVMPYIQSCFWNGKTLLIGAPGLEAKLDLDRRRAEIEDYDLELSFNRTAIAQIGKSMWVSKDEGGISGGCVNERTKHKENAYCILGLKNNEIHVDQIMDYKKKLLVSSLAGVVEIVKPKKLYKHYQITSDQKTMGVYELKTLNNEIWGNRDDGWVKFDLNNGKATVYQFANQDTSNVIYELNYFNNKWYVSNNDALFEITAPLNRNSRHAKGRATSVVKD